MTKQPLFLTPVFQERIWGGTALKEQFNYDIPSDKTGECWAISAHPNGQNTIQNGHYKGKTLEDLWENNHGLFGNYESEKFPLLTKILDANDDLSVQVHPDDEYAHANENGEYGKTECWYIIDCEEDAELIFGHKAHTEEEMAEMIQNENWDGFLQKVNIKPGDFFYVPSGTIHALGKGTLVLETQQSSDTTYRVYDFNRTDDQGNTRELHVEKSIKVTTIPHAAATTDITIEESENAKLTTFVQNDFFSVYKLDVHTTKTINQTHDFLLCSVIDGSCSLTNEKETYEIEKGTHFVLPNGAGEWTLEGQVELILSHP